MRIWDIPPKALCDRHLLGEHAELHAIWSVLTKGKKGYAAHPETLRWAGKLKALYSVHGSIVAEMTRRGFKHGSDLPEAEATGSGEQDTLIDSVAGQRRILKARGCGCRV